MNKIAVLPFNAAEGAKPQLGRQLAAFIGEQIRNNSETEVQTVSYLTQIEQGGVMRTAYVNLSDGLLDPAQLGDLFGQSGVDLAMDGLIKQEGESIDLTVRFTKKDDLEGGVTENFSITEADIFASAHRLVTLLAEHAGITLPAEMQSALEFGTENPKAFLGLLEGYDALNYIQQANGAVAEEFNPQPALDILLEAVRLDPDFQGPYQVLVGLSRACVNFRIGSAEMVEKALNEATAIVPDDAGAFFALGELYQVIGNLPKAVDMFEKASTLEPSDPAILTRLGTAQLQLGMPVNAERSFKKAMELEGDDKPSISFLADVLEQTGRGHEVPALWKEQIGRNKNDGLAHARYAISLINNGRKEEGEKAFEDAIASLEDNTIVKRFYAPYLANNNDADRAMDFYEDCLDVEPADIALLLEYAQTLQAADRAFEVPAVLQNVLKANPDPNTRAQTNAWLIELEQPKRVESVQSAQEKLEAGDFEGAIRELKPLRNWLADYWKMWALLSSAYNRSGQFAEAEDASRRLLEMFPGCEPAYGEYRESLNGQGRHDEAYQFMQFAIQNNPNSLSIVVNLAIAAKRAGKGDEAKQIMTQVTQAVQENADIMRELQPVLAEINA